MALFAAAKVILKTERKSPARSVFACLTLTCLITLASCEMPYISAIIPELDGGRAISSKAESPGDNYADSSLKHDSVALPPLTSLKAKDRSTQEIIALFPIPGDDNSARKDDLIISVDRSGEVLIWHTDTVKARILTKLKSRPQALAFLAKNLWLGVVLDHEIEILSLSNGSRVRLLPNLGTRVSAIDFEPSGDSLILAGADGRVYRWKFSVDGKATKPPELSNVERYIGPASSLTAAIFHPTGRVFFDGQIQGGISAWLTHESDLFSGRYDKSLFGSRFYSEKSPRVVLRSGSTSGVTKLALSAGGDLLCSAAEDGSLEFFDVRGLKALLDLDAHKGLIYDFALSPDGTRVASVGRDGKLKVNKLEKSVSSQMLSELSAKELYQDALPLARRVLMLSNDRVAAAGVDGRLQIIKIPLSEPQGNQVQSESDAVTGEKRIAGSE